MRREKAMNIKPADLAGTVNKLLKEYGDDAKEILEETLTKTAKDAAKQLKSKGDFGGSGNYQKGWKSKVEKKRLTIEAHVYNAKLPGLTQLLEFGHAKQNGGRTTAFPHIADVNTWAQDEAVSRLEEKL